MAISNMQTCQALVVAVCIYFIYKYISKNCSSDTFNALRKKEKSTKKVSFSEENTKCDDSVVDENKVSNMIDDILKRQMPE